MTARPDSFDWIENSKLGAMAEPMSLNELTWLRDQGVQVLLSLTEEPIRPDWIEAAGMLSVHIPVPDMTPPTLEQFEQCLSTIRKANDASMGVAVHCTAGLGRTGSVLAAYFISNGMSAKDAIQRIRDVRPGSIETIEQEDALAEFEQWCRHQM